jgi:hypothetical protein
MAPIDGTRFIAVQVRAVARKSDEVPQDALSLVHRSLTVAARHDVRTIPSGERQSLCETRKRHSATTAYSRASVTLGMWTQRVVFTQTRQ